MQTQLPWFIKAWFILDLVLALFPPMHWLASDTAPLLGMPRSLVYLAGLGCFIAASVVVAYLCDSDQVLLEKKGR
jgi:hypothetical protein